MWWVLEERDRYLREGPYACSFDQMDPVSLRPSTATCPRCNSLLEPAVWCPPCRAQVSRQACGDLIQGGTFELVVSVAAQEAFAADGLRGLTGYQRFKSQHPLDRQYVVARPRVTLTVLDEERSELRWRRPPACDLCRLGSRESVKRIVLKEDTWDGSDIFAPSGLYGVKMVTQRFVDWVVHHGFTNFSFLPANDYEDSFVL
jgi:hypothetical protein